MMHRLGTASLALVAALVIASPASAADEPATPVAGRGAGFRAGTVVLEDVLGVAPDVLGFGFGYGALGGLGGVGGVAPTGLWLQAQTSRVDLTPTASARVSTIAFSPSLDVFVSERVSLGGTIGFAAARVRTPTLDGGSGPVPEQSSSSSYGAWLVPRVGVALPIADGLSLWPKARAGVTLSQTEVFASDPTLQLGLDVPLVVRLARHAVVDFGPDLGYTSAGHTGAASSRLALSARGGLSLVF